LRAAALCGAQGSTKGVAMRRSAKKSALGNKLCTALPKVIVIILFISIAMAWAMPGDSGLQAAILNIDLGPEGEDSVIGPLQLLIFLSLITLFPSILIMMTSFTRIVVVLSLLRNALGA
jgi:flagellar biosynthetic protein FliP